MKLKINKLTIEVISRPFTSIIVTPRRFHFHTTTGNVAEEMMFGEELKGGIIVDAISNCESTGKINY